MADLKAIQEAVKAEDDIVDVTIYDRAEQPYKAADGSDSTIGVVGAESARYQRAVAKRTREAIKRGARRRTEQDFTEGRIELACAAVVRWHGWEKDGVDWPCTPENVRELLSTPHILGQVEEGIEGHRRFFGNVSKT